LSRGVAVMELQTGGIRLGATRTAEGGLEIAEPIPALDVVRFLELVALRLLSFLLFFVPDLHLLGVAAAVLLHLLVDAVLVLRVPAFLVLLVAGIVFPTLRQRLLGPPSLLVLAVVLPLLFGGLCQRPKYAPPFPGGAIPYFTVSIICLQVAEVDR